MRRLITRFVKKWMQREQVTNAMLLQAIRDLEAGLSTANLGSGLFKVRVARKDQGKSGGYRTLIVYRQDDRAIVVYGFKNPLKITSPTTNSPSSENLPPRC